VFGTLLPPHAHAAGAPSTVSRLRRQTNRASIRRFSEVAVWSERHGRCRCCWPRATALPPSQHRVVEGSPTSFVKNAAAATATCCCHPLHTAGAPSAVSHLPWPSRCSSPAPVAATAGPRAVALPPPCRCRRGCHLLLPHSVGCSGLCKCCFTCIWWSEGSNTLTLGKNFHLL